MCDEKQEHRIAELEKRVKELEFILDNLPVEVWYKDSTGGYIYVNEKFAEISGKKPEDVIGKKDYEVYSDGLAVTYRQDDWNLMSGGVGSVVKTASTTGKESLEVKNVIKDEEGKPVGIIGCGLESSFDEFQTLFMHDQRSVFNLVFDKAPYGMAIYDLNNTIPRHVNDNFGKILGISRFSALNMNWRFITHPDDIEANEALNEKLRAGDIDSYKMEKRFIHSSGDIVWAKLTMLKVPAEEKEEELLLCIIEDITEYKKLSEQQAAQ